MRGPADAARLRIGLSLARAQLEIARAEHLPRLRASIAARSMKEARAAAGELERALATIDAELRDARRCGGEGNPEIDALAAELDSLRADAAPERALAPPAAPALVDTPWALAYAPPSAEYHAAEHENEQTWNQQLDAADETDVPRIAALGVAGAGGPLPHLDTIQRSFGRHDVSGVDAHVGGPAAKAAGAIGAEAYAMGNDVAFAASPTLHTAAHEAAHVVQQRAGVQLLGGVGIAGDGYEAHADAVADAVVAGRSAGSLLGNVATGGPTAAVQRKESTGLAPAGSARDTEPDLDHPVGWNDLVVETDAVIYLHTKDDAAKEEKKEQATVNVDRWRPLIAAGDRARLTFAHVKSVWTQTEAALEVGRDGALAVLEHLGAIDGKGPIEGEVVTWYTTATATIFLLLDALRTLAPKDPIVVALEQGLADLKSRARSKRSTPTTVDGALKQAGKPKDTAEARGTIVPTQLRLARADLDAAIERFRKEKLGEGAGKEEGIKVGGSSANQTALFEAGAATAAERLSYLSRASEAGDLSVNPKDASHAAALGDYLDGAQRFVYWCVTNASVTTAAETVAVVSDPLAALIGRPPLAMTDPIPQADLEALDVHWRELERNWGKVFDSQRTALAALAKVPEPQRKGRTWQEQVGAFFAGLCLNGVFSYFAASLADTYGATATSALNEAGVGSGKAGTTSAIKDMTKTGIPAIPGMAAELLGDPLAKRARTAVSDEEIRKHFFEMQLHALTDIETAFLKQLDAHVHLEARRSPDGAAMLSTLASVVALGAADIAARQKQIGVQAWASYVAASNWGTDEATGGADLNAIPATRDYDKSDRDLERRRPAGILELLVEVGKPGSRPILKHAAVGGLPASDTEHLVGVAIGELRMPVQVRAFITYHEVESMRGGKQTGPSSFVVSSNGQGAVWVADQTVGGEAWLSKRDRAEGDPMIGATLLLEDLAGVPLSKVDAS